MAVISQELKDMLAKAAGLDQERQKLKREIKQLEEKVTAFNVKIDEISVQAHKEIVVADDEDTEALEIVLTGIGRVALEIDPCFTVLAGNRPELIRRLKQNEDTLALVKEDVNPKTLAKFCREAFVQNGCYPHNELIQVYNKPVLKFKVA
jgi:chromosome segregation ATPase